MITKKKMRKKRMKVRDIYLQHCADIAGTKDLMHNGKLARVVRRKVRSKDAVFGATASQQLARSTR